MAAFAQPGLTQLQLQRDCPAAALAAPGRLAENARPSVTVSGQDVRRRCGLAAAPAAPTVTSSRRSCTAAAAVATGSSAAAEAAAEDGAGADAAVATLPFRVGHGFDLHRLEPNLPLIIGGVNIPHDRGCEAHSDGDVLMHCVVDAILGALGLPDIGQLFPDNDPKWKGAPSHVFVTEAVRRMEEAGYSIGNLDSTIILQRPKLSPHKAAIKENLCNLLHASPAAINVKAKTHEKVDSLGENRSVACHTVVLLVRRQE